MLSVIVSAYNRDFIVGPCYIESVGTTDGLGIRLRDGKHNEIQAEEIKIHPFYFIAPTPNERHVVKTDRTWQIVLLCSAILASNLTVRPHVESVALTGDIGDVQ